MNQNLLSLMKEMDGIPVFSEHGHHKESTRFAVFDLDGIVNQSYCACCSREVSDPDSRTEFLKHEGHNSYWVWLQRGIAAIHGTDESITTANWDMISKATEKNHRENKDLDAYIDTAQNIRCIIWGSDCLTTEESVGAMLAWKHTLAAVVAKRLEAGLLQYHQVDWLLRSLIYENGFEVYDKIHLPRH